MVNVRNGLSLVKLEVFIIFICGLAEIVQRHSSRLFHKGRGIQFGLWPPASFMMPKLGYIPK